MPTVIVLGIKPCCGHQETQSTGAPKGTQPAQEELRYWSAEGNSLICLRGSIVCLCIGEVVEEASFQGVQRASLGIEVGPFPYSGDGAGAGNCFAQQKVAAVQLHFLVPVSPLKGVLRKNG